MKIKSSNVTIMVKSMDRSCDFYQKIGLKLQQRWGDHYAMLSAKDIVIGLHPADGKYKRNEGVSIGFMIDRQSDAKKLLTKLKIKFRATDGKSGKYVHFKDPDGTVLYFVEPGW
jgi:catechol 2,3-dioxygenase-like lactoylglutathione lyase family enzyme